MLERLTEAICVDKLHVSFDSLPVRHDFVTMLRAVFLKAKVEDHYSSSFVFHVSCLVATFIICIYLFLRGFVFL